MSMLNRTLKAFIVQLMFVLASAGSSSADGLVKFPASIDKNCRGGAAKIYDECSDQQELFRSALAQAKRQGKALIVSYGAEWCIWCHVFDAYISGGKTKFKYVYGSPEEPEKRFSSTLYEKEKSDVSDEAKALRRYFERNFVLVHIENYYSASGAAVVRSTGAGQHHDGAIPFVFVVDRRGEYTGHFRSKKAETRRDSFFDWYRGYDRSTMLGELRRLRSLAGK